MTFGVSAIASITSSVKSAGCGRGEADALRARRSHRTRAQQLAERVPVSELGAVGVHVLAEQGDLEHSVGDQRADLGEDVAGPAVLLLAAQARHDAERAGVVAADRDRDPGRVGRLAVWQAAVEGNVSSVSSDLDLRLVPDPGPLQQRRQRGRCCACRKTTSTQGAAA